MKHLREGPQFWTPNVADSTLETTHEKAHFSQQESNISVRERRQKHIQLIHDNIQQLDFS